MTKWKYNSPHTEQPQAPDAQNRAGKKPKQDNPWKFWSKAAEETEAAQTTSAVETETKDDKQAFSPSGLRGRIANLFSSLLQRLPRQLRTKTMSLDADEYNRRIKIVEKRRAWTNDAGRDHLDATSKKLLEMLDDEQASSEYLTALQRCTMQCTAAKEKYSAVQYNSFVPYRAEVSAALTKLIEEFTAQRDALQLDRSQGIRTAEPATQQNKFVDTGFRRDQEEATSASAQPTTSAIDNVPAVDDGHLGTSGVIEDATTNAEGSVKKQVTTLENGAKGTDGQTSVESDDWQRKYQEINHLYTRTQELLAETQAKLNEVSIQLAVEQKTIEDAKVEKEKQDKAAKDEADKVAAAAKEAADKKQWRIGELEEDLRTLNEAKKELEEQLPDLESRIAAANQQAKDAEAAKCSLQAELDEQKTPEKAREALQSHADTLPVTLREFVTGLLDVADHAADISWLENNIAAVYRFVYTPPEAVGLLAERNLDDIKRLYQVITLQDDTHKRLLQANLVPIYPETGAKFDGALHDHTDRDIIWTNNQPELDNKIETVLRVGFKNGASGKVLRKCFVRRYMYSNNAATQPNAGQETRRQEDTEQEKQDRKAREQAELTAEVASRNSSLESETAELSEHVNTSEAGNIIPRGGVPPAPNMSHAVGNNVLTSSDAEYGNEERNLQAQNALQNPIPTDSNSVQQAETQAPEPNTSVPPEPLKELTLDDAALING